MPGFGEGVFAAIPNEAFILIHAVTFLVALYFGWQFWTAKKQNIAYAFFLYAIGGLLFTFVHMGSVDNYFAHVTESVLVFVAFLMIGMNMKK